MQSPSGPGDWPIAWSSLPASRAVDAADQPLVGPVAVAALWAATGRRFGLVTATHTVRYLNRAHALLCFWPQAIDLPGPVYDVVQVVSGATVYTAADYTRADDRLIRNGGPWPEGPLVVTYRRGTPVPAGGDVAAADLAAEIAAARRGGKCRLPARATTISREGVDITLGDPLDYLSANLTGIPEVDAWITTHNPSGLRQDTVVWSPDLGRQAPVPRIGWRPW